MSVSSLTWPTNCRTTAGKEEDLEDLEDAPEEELEAAEDLISDQATASQTISELESEIEILKDLESMAAENLKAGCDRKWEELSSLLHDDPEMRDADGNRRKLVLFTEHTDTLRYLMRKIGTMLGPVHLVCIHGGMKREDRRRSAAAFTQDKDVQILVATDAAGEGINLQRAHLMVNYDLPWNPNRLEQRFGRIHRIGQTEVCHLWNLVAANTREGQVLQRLYLKIEVETKALDGQVFNVLGKTLGAKKLRDLLIESVRYGDDPATRARQEQVVDQALDHEHLKTLLEEESLAKDVMDGSQLQRIREDMERLEARKLQPHFIQAFFLEAFQFLKGSIVEREPNRFEIRRIPAVIRERDRETAGSRDAVQPAYERVTFRKQLIHLRGRPLAEFLCPGHPLMNAVIHLVLDRLAGLLRKGSILINERDPGEQPYMLFYLERRMRELEAEQRLAPLSPKVLGGSLVFPQGLLKRLQGKREPNAALFAKQTQRVEMLGMRAVFRKEEDLGHTPVDVSMHNVGYDIESKDGQTGRLRLIEVKGRIRTATTITVTKNEILTALNKGDDFILAIVLVPEGEETATEDAWDVVREPDPPYHLLNECEVHYLRNPFSSEPDFNATSVNFEIRKLIKYNFIK